MNLLLSLLVYYSGQALLLAMHYALLKVMIIMSKEKLIKTQQEAIECIKSNYPTSGYEMLKESLDMAIKALEKEVDKK